MIAASSLLFTTSTVLLKDLPARKCCYLASSSVKIVFLVVFKEILGSTTKTSECQNPWHCASSFYFDVKNCCKWYFITLTITHEKSNFLVPFLGPTTKTTECQNPWHSVNKSKFSSNLPADNGI